MDQISTKDIFNLNIRDLVGAELVGEGGHLLTLLGGGAFYPVSSWLHGVQLLFWRKPIGDTGTFKLMLFYLGNGCSPQLITE